MNKTKIIGGVECELRDVIYSDFGALTPTEKLIEKVRSSEEYKSKEDRANFFKDVNFSWTENENPYSYNNENTDDTLIKDKEFSENSLDEDEEQGSNISGLFDDELESLYSETSEEDREYSVGTLNTRLVILRRPLHIQLKDLYREHTRFYRSKASTLKPADAELLIEDFRYELHRVIAKAKTQVVEDGGNMDTILKVSALGGGTELQQTLRKLTILFKRVEQAYEKFGFIPRTYQTRMNESLSILVSHFILDVYGPELEKRKLESSELANRSVTR